MLHEPLTWDLVAPTYATENREVFEWFADRALECVELSDSSRVLDVAAGSGALALRAAPMVGHVDALDFSEEMLRQLSLRADEGSMSNVTCTRGDGQALPFEADQYDAAFSLFGLMFFPDRARGFAELFRVLKPGGRAVVSSWHPAEAVPVFAALGEAMSNAFPSDDEEPASPLTNPADIEREMGAPGFEVHVESRSFTFEVPSIIEFWAGAQRGFAPLVRMRKEMGDAAFETATKSIPDDLRRILPETPLSVTFSAWLGVGRKP